MWGRTFLTPKAFHTHQPTPSLPYTSLCPCVKPLQQPALVTLQHHQPPWDVAIAVVVSQGPYKTLQDLWDEPQPDYQALKQQVLARYSNVDKEQPRAQLNSGKLHWPVTSLYITA